MPRFSGSSPLDSFFKGKPLRTETIGVRVYVTLRTARRKEVTVSITVNADRDMTVDTLFDRVEGAVESGQVVRFVDSETVMEVMGGGGRIIRYELGPLVAGGFSSPSMYAR